MALKNPIEYGRLDCVQWLLPFVYTCIQLASCNLPDTDNYEVTPKFFENLWNTGLT